MGLQRMEVKLIGHYGDESSIVRQAGMSTGRECTDISGLIKRLMKWAHWKPFEVVNFHWEVKLPITIDRQLVTYRTMVASIAQSGRYGSTPLSFYIPKEIDSGILDEEDLVAYKNVLQITQSFYERVSEKYKDSFEGKHRSREVFRNILPQSQYTTRTFQMNLRNFLHFLEERTSSTAQSEIRQLALMMRDSVAHICPTVFSSAD
jgi:thymidylate synthase (FAD)